MEDDTDLPLPNKPLPNTGAQGALIEELDISEDEDDAPTLLEPRAGPTSPSFPQFRPGTGGEAGNTVTDITPYKKYVLPFSVQGQPVSCAHAYADGNNWTAILGGRASIPFTSTPSVPGGEENGG